MDEWEDQLQADFVQRAQCVAVHHTSCFFESLVRKPATTRCKKLQELHSWLLGTLRTSTHVHPVQHSSVARHTSRFPRTLRFSANAAWRLAAWFFRLFSARRSRAVCRANHTTVRPGWAPRLGEHTVSYSLCGSTRRLLHTGALSCLLLVADWNRASPQQHQET